MRQLADVGRRAGALQEEQNAIRSRGIGVASVIDEFRKLKEKMLGQSKTAGLTLSVGVVPVPPDTAPAEPAKAPLEVI